MPRKPETFLQDMLNAARGVQKAVAGRSFEEFAAEQAFRWAVERGCEIIGEALTQLRKIDAPTAESLKDWKDIIGFRNVIVHGYAVLDAAQTWKIAIEDIPKIIAELESMLGK